MLYFLVFYRKDLYMYYTSVNTGGYVPVIIEHRGYLQNRHLFLVHV